MQLAQEVGTSGPSVFYSYCVCVCMQQRFQREGGRTGPPRTGPPPGFFLFIIFAPCPQAGLPAGALNLVTGKGSEIGDAITHHPGIDKVRSEPTGTPAPPAPVGGRGPRARGAAAP
jgi:hypothetical protein